MQLEIVIKDAELKVGGSTVGTFSTTVSGLNALGILGSAVELNLPGQQLTQEDRWANATPFPTPDAMPEVTPSPDATASFNVGDAVFLDGVKFRGEAKVEKLDGDDVIIRLAQDEDTGRTDVRIRVNPEDIEAGRLLPDGEVPADEDNSPAAAPTFSVGDAVMADGTKFSGPATVEKLDGDDVIVRMDDGERDGKGSRVRFLAEDVTNGMLSAQQ